MPKGEAIYSDFIIATNPSSNFNKTSLLDIPEATFVGCSDAFLVFSDGMGADAFKNDITSIRKKYPMLITSVTMELEQFLNGNWESVDTLNDNTFGEFFQLSHITDDYKNNYIGYKLNWTLIYNDFGEGLFRIKFTEDIIIGGENINYSNEYCLKLYHSNFADGTIKIETYTNKLLGDINNPYEFSDYRDLNWYNSIRLNGFFGEDNSSYETEYIEFNNGSEQWIKNEQKINYILTIKPVDSATHKFISTDIIQSDLILITDYNKNNPNSHVQTPVRIDGAYQPNYLPGSLKSSVQVQFKLALNNLRKKRC